MAGIAATLESRVESDAVKGHALRFLAELVAPEPSEIPPVLSLAEVQPGTYRRLVDQLRLLLFESRFSRLALTSMVAMNVRDEESVDSLHRLASVPDMADNAIAAMASLQLTGPKTIELIRGFVDDPSLGASGRKAAITALRTLAPGNPSTYSALRAALQSDRSSIQIVAAESLIDLGYRDPEIVDVLASLSHFQGRKAEAAESLPDSKSSSDHNVARQAESAWSKFQWEQALPLLGRIGSSNMAAVKAVSSMLMNPDRDEWIEPIPVGDRAARSRLAADTLAAMGAGDAETIRLLYRTVEVDDLKVRWHALKALSQLGVDYQNLRKGFISLFSEHSQVDRRLPLANPDRIAERNHRRGIYREALDWMMSSDPADPLTHGLLAEIVISNWSAVDPSWAADILALYGEIPPGLLDALRDLVRQDPYRQSWALQRLLRLSPNDPVANTILGESFGRNDRYPQVLFLADLVDLNEIQPSVVPQLWELTRDQRPYVRLHALEILQALGEAAGRIALEVRTLMSAEEVGDRAIKFAVQARMNDEDTVRELFRLAVAGRSHAVRALTVLARDDPRTLIALQQQIRTNNQHTRSAAMRAFLELGGQSAEVEEILREQFATSQDWPQIIHQLSELGVDELDLSRLVEHRLSPSQAHFFVEDLRSIRPTHTLKFVVGILGQAYSGTSPHDLARWRARYWAGNRGDAQLICDYLGRPRFSPESPATREAVLDTIRTLARAMELAQGFGGSAALLGDAAAWIGVLAQRVEDDLLAGGRWVPSDLPELERIFELLEDTDSERAQASLGGFRAILERLRLPVSREAQTFLLALLMNLGAVLFLSTVPVRKTGAGSPPTAWMLVAAVFAVVTALASWNVASFQPFWLVVVWLGAVEVLVLVVVALRVPPLLRRVSAIEPLGAVLYPLALRDSGTRRKLLAGQARFAKRSIDAEMDEAREVSYISLPARLRCRRTLSEVTENEPATSIVDALLDPSLERPLVVYVEAPGGRGKSALMRGVASRTLREFESGRTTCPVPVFVRELRSDLIGLARDSIGAEAMDPRLLEAHLERGDFMFVIDDLVERGIESDHLSQFLRSDLAKNAVVLLATRPGHPYFAEVQRYPSWLRLDPLPLNDATLPIFLDGYRCDGLPNNLRNACASRDGSYSAILVRMAISLSSRSEEAASLADLYREYFLESFSRGAKRARFSILDEASHWCVESYWRRGERTLLFDGSELQERLLAAGLLIPAGTLVQGSPSAVRFFHDSMQSFLAASGLLAHDQRGYSALRTGDDPPWDRGRVMIRAAADARFRNGKSDVLGIGGSELFEMLVAVFGPHVELREWFFGEVVRWSLSYNDEIRRKDARAALSGLIDTSVDQGSTRDLMNAGAEEAYRRDDSLGLPLELASIYARLAPLVYEDELTRYRAMAAR
jgi:hypothetical protein